MVWFYLNNLVLSTFFWVYSFWLIDFMFYLEDEWEQVAFDTLKVVALMDRLEELVKYAEKYGIDMDSRIPIQSFISTLNPRLAGGLHYCY